MMMSLRCLLVAVMYLFVGCSEGGRPGGAALFSSANDSDRVVSSVVFDTAWVIGGADDTLLAMPSLPRSYGNGGLVFLDLQAQKVSRVLSDGSIAWSWGRKGEGSGELMNVRALDVRKRDGAIVLLDSGNRRIVTLNTDGELVGETPLVTGGNVHSVAVLADDNMAVHTSRTSWGVWSSGSLRTVSGVPSVLQEMPFLQSNGRIAAWRDDLWVFGFGYGNGWIVFQDTSAIAVHPYVEHYDFPDVRFARRGLTTYWHMDERPPSSGRSVSVRGDTLYVLFGGLSPSRGFMLDTYELRTGKYLETHLLPHYANRAVVGMDGSVFTVDNSGVFPKIVALTPQQEGTK